jgi:hypothetical protein
VVRNLNWQLSNIEEKLLKENQTGKSGKNSLRDLVHRYGVSR